MDVAIRVIAHIAIVFGIIAFHEAGHYLAGLLAGVPAPAMKIVLLRYPFHVALRDGDTWRSPLEGAQYAGVMQRLIPGTGALFLFVSGGLVVQTVAAAALSLVLQAFGLAGLGWFAAAFSAGLVLFYLAIEAVGARVPAMPPGDVRGMISLSPAPAIGLLVAIVAVHTVLLLAVL